MTGKRQVQDGWWTSPDGLKLHYRDYPGDRKSMPILCMHGLSRNARDFEPMIGKIDTTRRIIAVSFRGRGESASSPDPSTYNPLSYLGDIQALLAELKIKRFIAIGTSMGGIMTMLLAATKPGRIAGAVINDIGPDIETAGLDRIKSYVGKSQSWPTWIHAARGVAEIQGAAYPAFGLEEWLAFAKRTCRLTPQGRIMLDYDMKISEPMKEDQAATDLWPMYKALGDVQVTILRGALSDILSETTTKRMVKELPNAKAVTVKGVGHAPMLDEPEAVKAINALLRAIS